MRETPNAVKKLDWSQRISLIRHYLHAASRTGDFSFFKTVQAHGYLEGIDHVATLTAVLGEDADSLLWTLHNINSGIAYVHEDAFKNVYDRVKDVIGGRHPSDASQQAVFHVDATQQKQMADLAIDKMLNSATILIGQQPPTCQNEAANVLLMGTMFTADAMEVCLAQIDQCEKSVGDFIRLEESWSLVQHAVGSAVNAIKGVFTMMAPSEASENALNRVQSHDSYARGMLRKMSTAFATSGAARANSIASSIRAPSSPSHSRKSSIVLSLPSRDSVSMACPTSVPASPIKSSPKRAHHYNVHTLEPIPPTPAGPVMDPFAAYGENGINFGSSTSNVPEDPTEGPKETSSRPMSTGTGDESFATPNPTPSPGVMEELDPLQLNPDTSSVDWLDDNRRKRNSILGKISSVFSATSSAAPIATGV